MGRAFWLVAPMLAAGLVHVAVITSDLVPGLAKPIDRGRRWRGREILGRNKTWRGFVVMPLATAVATGAQGALAGRFSKLADLPVPAGVSPWLGGAACGLAYVVSELPNSFVKRGLGIAPGASGHRLGPLQYLVDQLDSVVGSVVAVILVYRVDARDAVAAGVLGGALHVCVERAMRALPRRRRASG